MDPFRDGYGPQSPPPEVERTTSVKLVDLCDAIDRELLRRSLWYRRIRYEFDRSVRVPKADGRPKRLNALEVATFQEPSGNIRVQADQVSTKLTPHRRLSALSFDDPVIGEGFRFCLYFLSRMNAIADENSVRFVVLFIPTKEFVYSDIVQAGQLHGNDDYTTLIQQESLFWDMTRTHLMLDSIEYIDPLPALRRSLENNEPVYPSSDDGHLSDFGYQVVAEDVVSGLR